MSRSTSISSSRISWRTSGKVRTSKSWTVRWSGAIPSAAVAARASCTSVSAGKPVGQRARRRRERDVAHLRAGLDQPRDRAAAAELAVVGVRRQHQRAAAGRDHARRLDGVGCWVALARRRSAPSGSTTRDLRRTHCKRASWSAQRPNAAGQRQPHRRSGPGANAAPCGRAERAPGRRPGPPVRARPARSPAWCARPAVRVRFGCACRPAPPGRSRPARRRRSDGA